MFAFFLGKRKIEEIILEGINFDILLQLLDS